MLSLLIAQAKKNINDRLRDLGTAADLPVNSPGSDVTVVAGRIIRAALVIMGTVFLAQMVYAGYLWMTARGDETQVTKGKNTIERAATGLIVVLAAYAISVFVVNSLTGATGVGDRGAEAPLPPGAAGPRL